MKKIKTLFDQMIDFLFKYEHLLVYLGALFVFVVMYRFSSWVPLAGDDWGYALPSSMSAFERAWDFYFTWSGRFFSELYGFSVAPNKELWNVLNASLFTLLYVCVVQLVAKKHQVLIGLVFATMIVNVDRQLRIETHTWVMGTTYVIPLVLMVLYFCFIQSYVLYKKKIGKMVVAFCLFLNFYIGLTMENAAGILVLGNVLMMIYMYIKHKQLKTYMLPLTITSMISLAAIRLSPGAMFRMSRDSADFSSLPIWEQIGLNWKNFIEMTFVNNQTMFALLCIAVGILVAQKFWSTKNKWMICLLVLQIVGLFVSLSPTLYNETGFSALLVLFDIDYTASALWFTSIFYVVYTGALIASIFFIFDDQDEKAKALFLVMLGGSANLIMLISPIFGSRSSIYTVYFLYIFTCFVISKIKINRYVLVATWCVVAIFLLYRSRALYYKYQLVDLQVQDRMSVIEYYRANPQEDEIWIERMPPLLVHSADIEAGDEYHFEVFKAYYGLNPDADVIFFEYQLP